MERHDLPWHEADIRDELNEFEEATGFIDRWSEASDVVYTYTRAGWDGYTEIKFPISKMNFYTGLLYMFPKYSLRAAFYRKLGRKLDKNVKIREVRNPKKIEKLKYIAEKYHLDPEKFTEEAEKLMKRWVFLK